MNKTYIGIAAMFVVMLGAVIFAFYKVGSPFHTRALKLDQQRLSDFVNIKYSVTSYYTTNYRLPTKLSELPKDYYSTSLIDPETNKPYDYVIVSDATYKLCTEFSTDSNEEKNGQETSLYGVSGLYGPLSSDTTHKKGYDCISYVMAPTRTQQYIPSQVPGTTNFGTSSPGLR